MNTFDAHLQGLSNAELDSVARQILDKAAYHQCSANDIWTAVRMTAEDENSMSLYAVGMTYAKEYPKGHDWTYTPGGQVLREVGEVLDTRRGISPRKGMITIRTKPIPCSNEVRVGLGQQFLLNDGTKSRSLGYQDFYSWEQYSTDGAPVGSIIRRYNEVEGQRGWEYWEVVSI